jgi:hypothetical protein
LLTLHKVWLDKCPGPISKSDLIPMGFWLHVLPGFASTHSFHNQLTKDISSRYGTSPVVAALNLPTEFTEPDVYFAAAKCSGTYDAQSIQSNALCMYGSRPEYDRTTPLVTRISLYATTVDDKSPLYVPFALKQSHPDVYSHYLARQNAFLESHQNIAIVGVHPTAMDYGDDNTPDAQFPQSIWNILSNMDGVYRVDSC